MTAPQERCWYTLDPKAQPVGPYSISDLTGYAASGLVSEVQVFWKEGKPSWDKLSEVPELESVLQAVQQHKESAGTATAAAGAAAAAAAAATAAAAASRSKAAQGHPHHAVVLTGKASDALDVFKNAIAAVEAGAADEAVPDSADGEPAAAEGAGDRAATPEELEFEDDDGTLYRWDHKLRKYVPAAEAEAAANAAAAEQQRHDYDVDAMTFVAEEEVIPTLAAARAAEEAAAAALEANQSGGVNKRAAAGDINQGKGKKAKGEAAAAAGEATGAAAAGEAAAGASSKQEGDAEDPKGWFELKVNTSVYVTGLPDDTDVDEVAQHFARCGLVKLDDAGQPRIKLYKDKQSGMLKGDGLVTYLREPSVDLACQILDGAPLRSVGRPLSVTVAQFEMKGQQYKDKAEGGSKPAAASKKKASKGSGGGRGGRGGGRGGSRGGKKKQFSQAEKQARKLGWGGFDDVLPPERVTVVLKGMFTLDEAAAGGAAFATELETDVAAECTKLGVVEKVRVFATHPQGIVTVRFKQEEPAQACLSRMNGRFFGGHQIVAHMWDGFTSYHIKVKEQETAEEQAVRLEAFARELEQQQHAAAAAAATADEAAAQDAAVAAAADDMDITEAEQAGDEAAATGAGDGAEG